MIILSLWSNPPEEDKGVELDSTVITVPNMSLSVKQILDRFTRGTVSIDDLVRRGYYDDENVDLDDDSFDDVDDLSDLQTIKNNYYDKVSQSVRRDYANFDKRARDLQERERQKQAEGVKDEAQSAQSE